LDNLIKTLFGLLLRAVLLLMGLLFFASVLVAAVLLLALWLMRALWARLTGQPVQPWTFQIRRRAQWSRFYRQPQPGPARSPHPADDPDVIDVEPKAIKPPKEL
jgi:hypothetical protein